MDGEFVEDVGLDGLGEGEEVLSGAASGVVEDEGLAWPNAGAAEGAPFPAGAVDEPAGGELVG